MKCKRNIQKDILLDYATVINVNFNFPAHTSGAAHGTNECRNHYYPGKLTGGLGKSIEVSRASVTTKRDFLPRRKKPYYRDETR